MSPIVKPVAPRKTPPGPTKSTVKPIKSNSIKPPLKENSSSGQRQRQTLNSTSQVKSHSISSPGKHNQQGNVHPSSKMKLDSNKKEDGPKSEGSKISNVSRNQTEKLIKPSSIATKAVQSSQKPDSNTKTKTLSSTKLPGKSATQGKGDEIARKFERNLRIIDSTPSVESCTELSLSEAIENTKEIEEEDEEFEDFEEFEEFEEIEEEIEEEVTDEENEDDGEEEEEESSDEDGKDDALRATINFSPTLTPKFDHPVTKESQESDKITEMMMKRKRELSSVIKLNKSTARLYDSPPISYEAFIRLFGPRNRKQASTQTHFVNEIEIQTDTIKTVERVTQWPPSRLGYVFEDQSDQEKIPSIRDPVRFLQFLEYAEKLVHLLILEDEDYHVTKQSRNNNSPIKVKIDFPRNFQAIKIKSIWFDGAYVYAITNATFKSSEEKIDETRDFIFVWLTSSFRKPEYILTGRSSIEKIISSGYLIFAAFSDSSLAVWDIREPESRHAKFEDNVNHEHPMIRGPSHITALSEPQSHKNRIIEMIHQKKSDFCDEDRLLTIDERFSLIFWKIQHIADYEFSLSETGQGMHPFSGVRLTRFSMFDLGKFQQLSSFATCFDIVQNAIDTFLLGTISEGIVKYSLNELSSIEKAGNSNRYEFLASGANLPALMVKFNQYNPKASEFLAAYQDASICLFSLSSNTPKKIWSPNEPIWTSLSALQWISSSSFAISDRFRGIFLLRKAQDQGNDMKSDLDHLISSQVSSSIIVPNDFGDLDLVSVMNEIDLLYFSFVDGMSKHS
ncbi:cytoplasmic dynein 2 intermediate chain 1-like [Brevipalpus obovatus]|uniref:cytoplasmic dynein 2 intermediate chain 1-like n=1 Tax=Brevipalpus obovatus TaxID=246614 RepID=UPI003D9E7CB0